jgi:hypothetical protein
MASFVKVKCRNSNCDVLTPLSNLKEHEANCLQKPFSCIYNCAVIIKDLHEFQAHLCNFHSFGRCVEPYYPSIDYGLTLDAIDDSLPAEEKLNRLENSNWYTIVILQLNGEIVKFLAIYSITNGYFKGKFVLFSRIQPKKAKYLHIRIGDHQVKVTISKLYNLSNSSEQIKSELTETIVIPKRASVDVIKDKKKFSIIYSLSI